MTIDDEIIYLKNKKRIFYDCFSVDLKRYLNDRFPNISIQEQFYLVSNGCDTRKICEYENCSNFAIFDKKTKKYSKGCSKDHATKIAIFEKFGVKNLSQCQEFRQKAEKTIISKYGGWGNSSESTKEKYRKTNILKFEIVVN